MGFHQTMGFAVAEASKHLQSASPTVVELGNQRFKVTDTNLERISQMTGKKFNFPANKQVRKSLTKDYFVQLGFNNYLAIDVNDEMNAVVMDLNYDLRSKYNYQDQFTLVTNNGTSEHIFDQRIVFENIHNLCQVNGIMLHSLPFSPWLNHGFFNYNPVLFRDLAYANNYEWVFCWIGDTSATFKNVDPEGFVMEEPVLPDNKLDKYPKTELTKTIETFKGNNVQVYAALRKTNDNPFVVPFQGKYIRAIDRKDIKEYQQPDTFQKHHS